MKKWLAGLLTLSLCFLMMGSMGLTASAAGKGDINNDGMISSADVRALIKIAIGDTPQTMKQLWWGDYDGNGILNTTDARRLVTQIVNSSDNRAIDYVNVAQTNIFGDKTISVLGDSMSYGVGSGEIAAHSYVGRLKQAVNQQTGCNNYGFASVRAQSWEATASARSYEIHGWPSTFGTWAEERNQTYLTWDGFTSCTNWNFMDYSLRDGYAYDYFCVYYAAGPDQGVFSVSDTDSQDHYTIDGKGKNFSCYAASATPARTGYFRMSDFKDKTIRITVQGTGKNVTITGIGYYNDISDTAVTVNNFSSGGLRLGGDGTLETGLNKNILKIAAQADTMIFALGYNDAHFEDNSATNRALFTDKINYLIEQVNANGTHLIVNDLCWYIPSFTNVTMNYDTIQWYKGELKRLATATNGIYLDQQAINGDPLIATITDGAHPNADGHWMIADTVLQAMGLL